MRISVIIPFYNEEENVHAVLSEVQLCLPDAEIIAVDDGSSDRTAEEIKRCEPVKCLSNETNLGQSAALYRGLLAATGDYCAMMDGDGQNDPKDIPKLVEIASEYDVVCGYRLDRQDTLPRKIASKLANSVRRFLLQDGIRDTGCSLKLIKREHVRFLVPFNGLHRFLPALLGNAGLKITEIPVNHRPRLQGNSKYTIGGRALRGVYDLLGVSWLMRRQVMWKNNPY
ncbi:MAG: glycosyltransferase family 2 protein [Verrucomicrobiota bacterium]